jgi:glycosyltransferase involved in cell wall biosynthesis
VLNTSYEGLSHQLIEVMSLGVPVVTTPVGGNTELITDAETGILVPYNDTEKMHDALMRLYCDPALGTALATKAYTRTALFHEDVAIKEFVSLTHSLWKY